MKKKIIFVLSMIFILAILATGFVACDKNGEDKGNKDNSGNEEPAITSEVGQSYTHTSTSIAYASEEAKATMLGEMELTEEEFYNIYASTTLDVKFLAENKASVIYNMGGRGEVLNLYYKVESAIVTFYDSEDDMSNGNVKTDHGLFASQFKLSADYKTLQWIADMPNVYTVTLDCAIK